MTAKSDELIDELVAACIAFGRLVEPDWQTRIEKARRELEAERLELRKTLGWAYDLDEYKDNPEAPKESELRTRIAELEALIEKLVDEGCVIAERFSVKGGSEADLEDWENVIDEYKAVMPEVQECSG